jgi:hypothetical protein
VNASLVQAILPEPSLDDLRQRWPMMTRHLREPPRKKRTYQAMPRLF